MTRIASRTLSEGSHVTFWTFGCVLGQCAKLSPHGSKVVSTHLWNTPLNLYQQAIMGFLS